MNKHFTIYIISHYKFRYFFCRSGHIHSRKFVPTSCRLSKRQASCHIYWQVTITLKERFEDENKYFVPKNDFYFTVIPVLNKSTALSIKGFK